MLTLLQNPHHLLPRQILRVRFHESLILKAVKLWQAVRPSL
jgi:hypothetical protein